MALAKEKGPKAGDLPFLFQFNLTAPKLAVGALIRLFLNNLYEDSTKRTESLAVLLALIEVKSPA